MAGIDPNIALNVLPPQQQNPTAILQSAAQFGALQQERQALAQERQQQIQAAQQKQAEQNAINQALQTTVDANGNVDVDAAASLLTKSGHGSAAETLRENHAKFVDQEIKNRSAAADALNKQLDNLQRLAGGVSDQDTLNAYRQTVAQTAGPTYAAALPTSYDQKTWAPVLSWFDTAKDSIDRQKAALDAVKDAREANDPTKAMTAVGHVLSIPGIDFNAAKTELTNAFPQQKDLIAQIQTPEQAGDLLSTPEQRQTQAREAAGQAFTQDMEKKRLALEQQRVQLEKQRNDLTANNNSVTDLTPFLNKTATGRAYINLADFQTPQQKSQAIKMANDQGIPYVDDKTDKGLRSMDRVRSTLSDILTQIQDQLPKDAAGRITGGLENKLSKFTQNSPILAAYDSWRPAAIGMVQALADPGLGLRINKNEIDSAMNGLPLITDTAATAIQKVQNVLKLLSDKEGSTLTRDRSSPSTTSGGSFSTQYTGSDGKSHTATFPTQAALDAFKKDMGIK